MQTSLVQRPLVQPSTAARRTARPRSRLVIASSAGRQPEQEDPAAADGSASQPAYSKASRRAALVAVVAGIAAANAARAGRAGATENAPREGEFRRTDAEWRAALDPSAYRVLRQAGTELPTSSPLLKEKRAGTFVCGGCGQPLFSSETKYESGTGWPSFYAPLKGAVKEELDLSIVFLPRTEIRCSRCLGHLGHSFNDGPPPTGMRYCMNGAALKFEPASA